MLDHLRHAGPQLARRERRQRGDVGHHDQRLVEGADHVLAARVVYRGLTADRRVHLREQRGRHLNQGHAPLVHGSREPGKVAHDAAAERHDRGLPVAAAGDQGVQHLIQGAPVLGLLAVGDHDLDRFDARRGKRAPKAREIERRDDRIRHDRNAARLEILGVQRCLIEDSGPDVDRVSALAQLYTETLHRSSIFASSSRARPWTDWVPVSTTMSATWR